LDDFITPELLSSALTVYLIISVLPEEYLEKISIFVQNQSTTYR
jgi:hypothetical protein